MANASGPEFITPSAVGEYAFCARAAWYAAQGKVPSRAAQARMATGTAQHQRRERAGADAVQWQRRAQARGRAFAVVVVVLLGIGGVAWWVLA